MIRHLVLFNLKPEIDEAGNCSNRGKYRSRIAMEFEWARTMEFEDEAGRYTYPTGCFHMNPRRSETG